MGAKIKCQIVSQTYPQLIAERKFYVESGRVRKISRSPHVLRYGAFESEGKLIPDRTLGNQRIYSESQFTKIGHT
ncbi:hypothetical protein H6F84_27435 [Microcoleus sp. FACHB-84]|nr:hypothetical protein [Microcoleus sp. FACHB-84]